MLTMTIACGETDIYSLSHLRCVIVTRHNVRCRMNVFTNFIDSVKNDTVDNCNESISFSNMVIPNNNVDKNFCELREIIMANLRIYYSNI